jgi:tetratricopeptide (TPR) repeat protein
MRTFAILLFFSVSVSVFAQTEIELYNRASAQFQYQNYDEAIALLTKAILAKANFADAIALRGDCYYYLKDYPSAIENYEKDVLLKKNRSSYSLACTYALAGRKDDAFRALEMNLGSEFKVRMSHIVQDADLESLRNDSRWDGLTKKHWYTTAEATLHEADLKVAANDLSGALQSATKAISLDPKNAKAYGNRALLHLRSGDLNKCLSDLNEAIRLDPASVYYGNRGYTHNKLGNKENALADYEKAVQLDPTNLVYYDLGIARYSNGNRQAALEALKRHVSYFTMDEMGLYFAGIIASEVEQFNEALNYLNRAIEINNAVPEFYQRRGDAYFLLKQYEGALQDYNKLIELDPSNAYAFYLRGNAKGSLIDKDGACEDWRKAQQMGYEDPNGYIKSLCN